MSRDDDESEKLAASFRPSWDSEATVRAEAHPSVHEAPTVQVPPEHDKERTLEARPIIDPKEDVTLPAASAVGALPDEPRENTLTLKPKTQLLAVPPMRAQMITMPTNTVVRRAPVIANGPGNYAVTSDDEEIPKRSNAPLIAGLVIAFVVLGGIGAAVKVLVLSPKIATNDSSPTNVAAQSRAASDIPLPTDDTANTSADNTKTSDSAPSAKPSARPRGAITQTSSPAHGAAHGNAQKIPARARPAPAASCVTLHSDAFDLTHCE